MRSALYLLMTFLLIIMISSCSNKGNPVLSEPSVYNPGSSPNNVSDLKSPATGPHSILGAWELLIYGKTLTAELVSSRASSAIGNIFDADLSQFLTVRPCSHCLWVKSVSLDSSSNLVLEIGIKHPFGNINSRPDLHGFDVRAIFIASDAEDGYSAITMTKPDGTVEPVMLGNVYFKNPDGYTSHYSELIADDRYFQNHETVEGNLFPFLRFFDDPQMGNFDPKAPSGYNVMPVGSAPCYRKAVIDDKVLGVSDPYEMYIIADVAYGQSAVLANRQNPQYYLPAFNRTEPWRLEYWLENNLLDGGDPASTADLMVQIFDWQTSATVDPSYPNPSNLTGVKEASRVKEVEVYIPNMMTNSIKVTAAESGNGNPDNPLTCRIPLVNELNMSGVMPGLVAVRDELYGSQSPSGRVPIPASPAGFPYETLDIRDYALYQLIYINFPKLWGITQEYNNELYVYQDTFFNFNNGNKNPRVEFFIDPTGLKFQYDWDWDYDGVTFNVDASGNPAPDISYTTPGRHPVGLRIRTTSVPPREYFYVIDAYRNGEVTSEQFSSNGSLDSITSVKRGHAIDLSTDGTCNFVYTNKAAGRWDIYLGTYLPDGTSHFHRVTTATDANYFEPSIIVKEDSPGRGICITFTSKPDAGMDLDVFSITGNIDGTGFDQVNIKPVATGGMDLQKSPVILQSNNVLYIYYESRSIISMKAKIKGIRSTDFGATWIDDTFVDFSVVGANQTNPTAALDSEQNRVYVAWEDDRYNSISGIDIFCAYSNSGELLTFNPSLDISPNSYSVFNEMYPEICVKHSDVYLAYYQDYLFTGMGLNHIQKRSMLLTGMADYSIIQVFDRVHRSPSFQPLAENQFLLATSGYQDASTTLQPLIIENFFVSELVEMDARISVGCPEFTMGPDGVDIFPCLKSREILGGAAYESVVVFRDFEDGFEKVTNPLTEYFGEIHFARVISQAFE